jgi:type II restriction enzyme
VCPICDSSYQLKAQSCALARRIVDAAYSTMVRAIREDKTPNLVALHYDLSSWRVVNVILIPHFAFSLSAVEKRKALGPTARRAGWVGCNILLDAIPSDARIPIIRDGGALPPFVARRQYARLRPLENIGPPARGWALDVLNAIRSLGKPEFTLRDAYSQEGGLSELHPDNRHVRDKIRQQLQVLRDLGLVRFRGRGTYELLKPR